jgi:hypothetical protein
MRAGRAARVRAGFGRAALVAAPLPQLLIRRGLLAPCMLAHVIVQAPARRLHRREA